MRFELPQPYQRIAIFPGNLYVDQSLSDYSAHVKLILATYLSVDEWKTVKGIHTFDVDEFVRHKIKTNEVYKERRVFDRYPELLRYVCHDSNLYHIMARKMSGKSSIYEHDVRIEKIVYKSLFLLIDHEIDVVVTHDTPHVMFEYIFCKVASFLKIDIYNIRRTPLPWKSYLEKGLVFGELVQVGDNEPSGKDHEDVDGYVQQKLDSYENAIPIYEKRRLDKYKGKIWNWRVEIVNHFFKSGKKPHISAASLWAKYQAYKRYEVREGEWNESDRFVSLLLHYQPERTTLPEGDIFDQQILAIRMLRLMLPEDVKIIVKEHPSTFRLEYKYNVRPHDYYKTIASIPNVILAPMQANSFDLIGQSLFTATITGTVAIEAVCRGKSCIYFGNAQFKNMPGAYHISEVWANESLISGLVSGELNPTIEDVKSYFHGLLLNSFGHVPEGKAYTEKDISYLGGGTCLKTFVESVAASGEVLSKH